MCGIAMIRLLKPLDYYQEKYGYQKGNFPIAEYIGEHTLSLPLYPLLLEEEVAYVCEVLQRLA